MSLRPFAQLHEEERLSRIRGRLVFETIVTQAADLVETHGMDPFDAADKLATRYEYDDFQAVLDRVRAEVDRQ